MQDQPQHCDGELRVLAIVEELRTILGNVLSELPGKPFEGFEAQYVVYTARLMNQSAEAYLILRKTFRVSASKLLIRPIIEVLINAAACCASREFLFRKAWTELDDDRKWLKRSRDEFSDKVDELKKWMAVTWPGYPVVGEGGRLSLMDAAEMADIQWLYDEHYRPYCQHTHGSLRAMVGQLDEHTDPRDTSCVG